MSIDDKKQGGFMDKILAIIAEYNPFHKGHLYHLNKAKDIVNPAFSMTIMSGHFTQRGEPALCNKWIRAKMAVEAGIDLVIELPHLYSSQSAEIFARGAISILDKTNLISHLAFGSEFEDLDFMKDIASILESEPKDFRNYLKDALSKGESFPAARMIALKKYIKNENSFYSPDTLEELLLGSNSILALEYLKAIIYFNSNIKSLLIPRVGSSYNDNILEGEFSSATAIRQNLLDNSVDGSYQLALPKSSNHILNKAIENDLAPLSLKSYEKLILAILRRASLEKIANLMDVEKGLEYRIRDQALLNSDLDSFIINTKTKRYTLTRIQRILINALLGVNKDIIKDIKKEAFPAYIRVLAFNPQGAKLLRKLKDSSSIPIITKTAHYKNLLNDSQKKVFEYDIRATNLYNLGIKNKNARIGNTDFKKEPVMIGF